MNKGVTAATTLLLLAAGSLPLHAQATVPFEPGMVVTESVQIEPGEYDAPGAEDLEEALITVRGRELTLDLTGVTLRGIPTEAAPNRARGVAIRVDGGSEVTIRGGRIRGYRFGILARDTRGLRIVDAELSYGWKPRLFSQVAHESLVDWLSYHQNDDREWMRFGAAIYLEGVTGGEIRGNRALQGMNGLLMTRTDSMTVRDNELAFNSGLGVGLYRSSHNRIVGNRLDYNVRGYSHGFYQRGQDSAGLLLYEQSSENVVAYNSATHSGDGLFLWAGQSTMDTGEGGANDNLIFGNDFSYAPTNAVEVTFSRNRIIANRLEGSRYGVWGGYSWQTLIAGNCIGGNEFGIAIEHGQNNTIRHNDFRRDSVAVALWANPSEPEGWGYPEHRDTRSRDTEVVGNRFAGHKEVWRLSRTTGLEVMENAFSDEIPEGRCEPGSLLGEKMEALAPELAADVRREVPGSELAGLGRSAMVVDEWGPYDWRSPKLWPVDTLRTPVRLRVMGPEGRWRVVAGWGVEALSAEAGRTGDTLVVTPEAESVGDWRVELEYVGAATVSPRGTERPAGQPVQFAYERFEPATDWRVRFFAWEDPDADPGESPEAFRELLVGEPILTREEPRLDYQWYGPLIPDLPRERWALEATTRVSLPPGEYSLRTISDDGLRLWVDGELVLDAWEPGGSTVDYAPLPGGEHDLRVRFYQLTGWTELRVEIVRGADRSKGSP